MDESVQRAPRLAPLPVDHQPDLKGTFKQVESSLGYVPNSFLIMQRKPKLLRPLMELLAAVWGSRRGGR